MQNSQEEGFSLLGPFSRVPTHRAHARGHGRCNLTPSSSSSVQQTHRPLGLSTPDGQITGQGEPDAGSWLWGTELRTPGVWGFLPSGCTSVAAHSGSTAENELALFWGPRWLPREAQLSQESP